MGSPSLPTTDHAWLHVSAQELSTGNQNTIHITDDSRLPPEQVSQMIHDAEQNVAYDSLWMETIHKKNNFEQYLNDIHTWLNHPDLTTNDILPEDRQETNQAILRLKDWLSRTHRIEPHEIDLVKQEFQQSCSSLLHTLFQRKEYSELPIHEDKDNVEITPETNPELVNELLQQIGS
mgnify:FL=1